MEKNKIVIPISGMHCRSCEILVEDSLSEISKIEKIVVDHKKGTVEIYYGQHKPDRQEIEKAICKAGYVCELEDKKLWLSRNPTDYKDLGIALLFLIGIYFVLNNLGLTNIGIGSAAKPSSLSVVLLIGITAGLSTCMALVGGLILGIAARHSEKHPQAGAMQKFRPHMFFNLGRVLGYAILGGLLGFFGTVVQLSAGTLGLMTILVGVVMLVLGIKLLGIFPRLENGGLTLPKSVARFLGIKNNDKEYSNIGAMTTGALTFFLPCGFTQAMQLYAVSTGSFAQGAMIMGVFALGTTPGLLGIGGLAAVVKGVTAKRFFKFAGIVVIFLALFNIVNGYNLTGGQYFTNSKQQITSNNKTVVDPNVKMENGVQVVLMIEKSNGYVPNKFTIKKGVPVRWEIDAQAPNSCASSLVSSKLNVQKTLKAGKNVIEFTPSQAGVIPFSCSMGMYTGAFDVVDENGSVSSDVVQNGNIANNSTGGGCGMISGGNQTGSEGGGCNGRANGGQSGCGGVGKAASPVTGTAGGVPCGATTAQ